MTIEGDEGDPTLWLCRTRGEALTSPPPVLLSPLEVEGGRITVTRMGYYPKRQQKVAPCNGGDKYLLQHTLAHYPLRGSGLTVRSPMASLLLQTPPVHQGLLNRNPRVTTAYALGRVGNERHCGRGCTLRARKTITREREIVETVSKM